MATHSSILDWKIPWMEERGRLQSMGLQSRTRLRDLTFRKAQNFFWGSKITADGHCSHEIKRLLLLGRKVITKLERVLKSRDISLPT